MNRIRNRNSKGFTMAELLVVIGITLILAAVGIIGALYYMRVMKQMEYDAMAKEIYIAAQNHLSMAYNEGYLDSDYFGNEDLMISGVDDTSDDDSVFYFVMPSVVPKKEDGSEANSLFDIILPFGSIDEKVRSDGSYIIRYDKDAGRIMDVFYSEKDGTRYGHTFLNDTDTENDAEYARLLSLTSESKKMARRYFNMESDDSRDNSLPIVGYYGSDSAASLPYGDLIETPYLRVINNEELSVEVKLNTSKYTDPEERKHLQIKLFIQGEVSKAQAYVTLKNGTDYTLNGSYETILDSITRSNMHFDELMRKTGFFVYRKSNKDNTNLFKSGENLTVWVEVFDSTKLTNIARSAKITTNSLFGDLSTIDDAKSLSERNADISNMRHLENLHKSISNLDVDVNEAQQNIDLDWVDFLSKAKAKSGSEIIYGNTGATLADSGNYYPVNLQTIYDGHNHKISNVTVNGNNVVTYNGPAGLFDRLVNKNVSNVQLVDFYIRSSSGNYAGALAGEITNDSSIKNVLAVDSMKESYIYGPKGAGGLVGLCESSTIDKSAAAVIVRGGTVGGLVASANMYSGSEPNFSRRNSRITNSYAAAHTYEGKYRYKDDHNVDYFDVEGTVSGGLIGDCKSTELINVYATSSVNGTTAGGLIGTYSGYAIRNAYAVGYVNADKEDVDIEINNSTSKGAFIGNDSSSANHISCYYMIAANDNLLSAFGKKSTNYNQINQIDLNKNTYTSFIPSTLIDGTRTVAESYDETLKINHQNKYQYKSIELLIDLYNSNVISQNDRMDIDLNDFVYKHFGDWPDYETQVMNRYTNPNE